MIIHRGNINHCLDSKIVLHLAHFMWSGVQSKQGVQGSQHVRASAFGHVCFVPPAHKNPSFNIYLLF